MNSTLRDKIAANAQPAATFSTELIFPLLVALDQLTIIQIEGNDAQAFLQGQLTNDVSKATFEQGQLTSYCTPKGRMLGIFYLCQWKDQYLLIVQNEIVDSIIKQLQMYVLRSKVTIKQLDPNWQLFGICGPQSNRIIQALDLSAPNGDYAVASDDNCLLIGIPGVIPRYIAITTEKCVTNLLNTKLDELQIYPNQYWRWIDILSGIPTVMQATQETFVPQMTNMELINGVNFSKGCYPGQEVVARLHYRGQASRRMYRLEIKTDEEISIGSNVFTSEGENRQSIGTIVCAINSRENHTDALAVLRIEAAESNQLAIASPDGMPAHVRNLPYEIPTIKNE